MAAAGSKGPENATVRVAVTQHEPVWLDLEGTVQKTCNIIQKAAEAGAKLVAFPGEYFGERTSTVEARVGWLPSQSWP